MPEVPYSRNLSHLGKEENNATQHCRSVQVHKYIVEPKLVRHVIFYYSFGKICDTFFSFLFSFLKYFEEPELLGTYIINTLLSLCREICLLARHLHKTFNTFYNKTPTIQ